MARLLLYYITDRTQFPGDEAARREQLLTRIAAAVSSGVDYIQLREKDLPARELELLARAAVQRIRESETTTRLLINSRVDVAIAACADGVHLPSDGISPAQARAIFQQGGVEKPLITVSCHTVQEVIAARDQQADFVVFGPVFEKSGRAGVGLERLREACSAASGIRILAVGGLTASSAADCMHAGAAGFAGIRLFQSGNLAETVATLRAISR